MTIDEVLEHYKANHLSLKELKEWIELDRAVAVAQAQIETVDVVRNQLNKQLDKLR